MQKADFLICGGGIVGLTIARELAKQGYYNIIVIDKENVLGKHASGRNSGVLHAGIYYSPDSLRARSCARGNLLLKQYCKEKKLPLLETGKVIVAKDEHEIKTLIDLYDRAVKNGAKVELIDEKQLAEIEPYAKTCEKALFSYNTAVVDPRAVLKSIYDDLISLGKVQIYTNIEFKGIKETNIAVTSRGEINFNIFINTAGAYSDKVAHKFDIGLQYRLIPFKGIYKKLKVDKSFIIKGNIYPVTDIRNPFLGLHFTKSVQGDVYLGPTAIPAFGRENYGLFNGMDREAVNILAQEAILFLVSPKFRNIVFSEPKKYIFDFFYNDIKKLVKGLNREDIISCDKVGIRPQLIDWERKELVMDFLIIQDGNSIHILNAISPAFTCSMDFAEHVVKKYIKKEHGTILSK